MIVIISIKIKIIDIFVSEATMNEGSGVSCLELSRIALVFLLSLIIGNYLQ